MKAKDINRVKNLMTKIDEIDREHRILKTMWEEGDDEWQSPIPGAVQCWLSLGTWQPSSTNYNTKNFRIHLTPDQMKGILRNYSRARDYVVSELHSLGVTEVK